MKKIDDDTYVLVQWKEPSWWLEWATYLCVVVLFVCIVMTSNMYLIASMAGILLFWNYRLFRTITEYTRYRNASEFSRFLDEMDALIKNETKDGTIPVQDGLTKEQASEETEDK